MLSSPTEMMARILPAIVAQGTRAADCLCGRLFAAAIWVVGCLMAAGYAFIITRQEVCSPR